MATGPSGTERTIGQLVADATHDLEGIVRGEIALAKAEVSSGAKVVGKGAGLLVGAGILGLIGFVFLLHGAAWGIGEVLPVWAGYLIVAVVVILVALLLGLLGRKSLRTAKPAPERAIDQAQQTIAVLKSTGSEAGAAATLAPAAPAGTTGASPTTAAPATTAAPPTTTGGSTAASTAGTSTAGRSTDTRPTTSPPTA